jgi:hypothetical protein
VFLDPGGSSTAGIKIPKRSGVQRRNDPKGNAQIHNSENPLKVFWMNLQSPQFVYSLLFMFKGLNDY